MTVPVLVIPGGPCLAPGYFVRAVEPVTRARGRDVLVADLHGRGALDFDGVVTELAAQAGPGADVVAHSWGTLLAQHLLLRHPGVVRSMTLVGAFPPRALTPDEEMRIEWRREALARRPSVLAAVAVARERGDQALAARLTGTIGPLAADPGRWTPADDLSWDGEAARALDAGLPATWDLAGALAAHSVPVTVIQGEHDYLDPGAGAWRDVPGVQITVLPGLLHQPWIDAPDTFATALRDALDRPGRAKMDA